MCPTAATFAASSSVEQVHHGREVALLDVLFSQISFAILTVHLQLKFALVLSQVALRSLHQL